jgi:hypothetical protein
MRSVIYIIGFLLVLYVGFWLGIFMSTVWSVGGLSFEGFLLIAAYTVAFFTSGLTLWRHWHRDERPKRHAFYLAIVFLMGIAFYALRGPFGEKMAIGAPMIALAALIIYINQQEEAAGPGEAA